MATAMHGVIEESLVTESVPDFSCDYVIPKLTAQTFSAPGISGEISFDANGDRGLGIPMQVYNHFGGGDGFIQIALMSKNGSLERVSGSPAQSSWEYARADATRINERPAADEIFEVPEYECKAEFYNLTMGACDGDARIPTYVLTDEATLTHHPGECEDTREGPAVGCDHSTLSGGVMGVAILGAIAECVLLVVLVGVWNTRAKKVMRVAQPRLLGPCVVGAMIAVVSVFTVGGEASVGSCSASVVIFTTGYNIMFGCLFVKLSVLDKILNNRKMVVIKITTKDIIREVSVFVVVNSLILVAMLVVDPPRGFLVEGVGTDGMPITSLECSTKDSSFTLLLIGWNFGLLGYGCMRSYKTRNAPAAYGENTAIAGSVYNTAICALVGCGIGLGIDLAPNTRVTITGAAIVLGCTMCILITMVSPIRLLTDRRVLWTAYALRVSELRCVRRAHSYPSSGCCTKSRGASCRWRAP